MLVEHEVLTTREPSSLLDEAVTLLTRMGFKVRERTASSVVACKTHQRPHYVRSLADLPQSVRVEHDRGRVQLALSVEDVRKEGPLHETLLLSLSRVLEAGLGEGVPAETALLAWKHVEPTLAREGRRRRRRQALIWVVLAVFLIAVVFLMIALFRP